MESNQKKIGILFVLPNFDTGGSEKLVFDIINHIDKNKFAPVLCVFFSGVYEDAFLQLKVPFYVVHPKGKIISKLKIVGFLNKIMREHKIQIVNTHHTSSLLQGLLSFKLFNRSKLVHTEHTRLNLDPNVTPRILFIQKIFMNFVDIALGISQGVCDYFEKDLGVSKKKIVKILNGVDIKRFSFDKGEERIKREKYRADFGITNKEIVIGMFANFRKQKNHQNLIMACELMVQKDIQNFKVILCGTGPEEETIQSLVKAKHLENKVILLGPRLDIPELMNMIDIYCLPSFFEGLPFSLIEAMAMEKAVVATDVEGNKEIIRGDKTGLLVNDNDSLSLANALESLIKNDELRKIIGQNAKLYVREFSFDNMIEKYKELFLSVIR